MRIRVTNIVTTSGNVNVRNVDIEPNSIWNVLNANANSNAPLDITDPRSFDVTDGICLHSDASLNILGHTTANIPRAVLHSDASLNIKGSASLDVTDGICLHSGASLNISDNAIANISRAVLHSDASLTITSTSMQHIMNIYFHQGSKVSFLYAGSELKVRVPENVVCLQYDEVIRFTFIPPISRFIASKFNTAEPSFALEDCAALRIYSQNKPQIKHFLQDHHNNFIDNLDHRIDSYITSHYFEISGICKNINNRSVDVEAPISLLTLDATNQIVEYLGGIEIIHDYQAVN